MKANSSDNNKDLTTIPSTMKAAVIHKIGDRGGKSANIASSDYITIQPKVPVPQPGPGEVLIRVSAAAINPIDWKLLHGVFPGKSVGNGLGLDVSGVVVQIGSPLNDDKNKNAVAHELAVGDTVYADIAATKTSGSFGEYCLCQALAASPKPKTIDFVQAASLPLAGLTALQGLVTHGGFQKGDKILILGGSGGVGSLATQMAKAMGASEIYSTGSDVERIKGFGADHVINYKKHNLMEALKEKDFDIVYDTIGGYEHWEVGQASLKKGGTFVTISGDLDSSLATLIWKTLWRKFMSFFGFGPKYNLFLTSVKPPAVVDDMKKITELVDTGSLKPVLDNQMFELTTESLHNLIKASMSHRAKGKLVMKVNC